MSQPRFTYSIDFHYARRSGNRIGVQGDRMKKDGSTISRRDLLKSAAIAGATLGLAGLRAPLSIAEEVAPPNDSVMGMKFEPRQVIRLGIIGVGARGASMIEEFLGVDGVQITAVCDIVRDKCLNAQREIEKAGHNTPALFFNG